MPKRTGKQLDLKNFEVFPQHPSFDTHNEQIDSQHRKLVLLLNKLANTLATDNLIEMDAAFSELADYAEFHFRDEEKIWRDHFGDDTWSQSHHKAHESFLPLLKRFREQGVVDSPQEVLENVVKFLIRWLAVHILEEDKRMSFVVEYVKKGYTLDEAKRISKEDMGGAAQELIEAVLSMYESLSTTALDILRERNARLVAEGKLKDAYRKLETLSITDQLTSLFNRRHLDKIAKTEVARAKRSGHALCCLMIDVDFFKKYNDRYGHLAGDEALKGVASAIRSVCKRPNDFVFRFGGEEFCVITSELNSEQVLAFAEQIRIEVEALRIPHEANSGSNVVTVSIGANTEVPSDLSDLDRFLAKADHALYRSKETGRNRVTLDR